MANKGNFALISSQGQTHRLTVSGTSVASGDVFTLDVSTLNFGSLVEVVYQRVVAASPATRVDPAWHSSTFPAVANLLASPSWASEGVATTTQAVSDTTLLPLVAGVAYLKPTPDATADCSAEIVLREVR
ncbi:MAG: hypothetical protein E6Q97_19360 [Desulfurellales bacterium]|nr:MAG: hypothetical protein E6Q97_19360 [Desulfurellales bacterium]